MQNTRFFDSLECKLELEMMILMGLVDEKGLYLSKLIVQR